MKKLLALLLSVILMLSLCTVAYAESDYIPEDVFNPEDGEEYQPFEDYYGFDENDKELENYEPMDTYYTGKLVSINSSVNISEIKSVVLLIGDVEHTVDVDTTGCFTYYLPDSRDTATLTIDDGKFYILPDTPANNNKVDVSLSSNISKEIYVGIRSNITGTVTNSDGSEKIAGATVTCYYRANENEEWSLWMNNEFSSSANTTTDENGIFSYAVTSGLYRFVIKKDGYAGYDSYEREYMAGIAPGSEETHNITFHLTADKFMNLESVTPDQGGTLAPGGVITLVFDKNVAKASLSDNNNFRIESVSTKSYVPVKIEVNGSTVTVTPTATLGAEQKFNIILTQNISATDGSKLLTDRVITFTYSDKKDEPSGGNNEQTVDNDITGHWSQEYMERLIGLYIIDGVEKDNVTYYYPDKPLTRGEFAKYIVMSQDIVPVKEITGTFKDGDMIAFELRPYVYAAYQAGLIKGSQEEDGLYFLPDATISRAEIITVLGRLMGDESDEELDFADAADVPDWARPYVAGCVAKGYVTGDSDTGVMLLRPLDNVTRCEAATIISKILADK